MGEKILPWMSHAYQNLPATLRPRYPVGEERVCTAVGTPTRRELGGRVCVELHLIP